MIPGRDHEASHQECTRPSRPSTGSDSSAAGFDVFVTGVGRPKCQAASSIPVGSLPSFGSICCLSSAFLGRSCDDRRPRPASAGTPEPRATPKAWKGGAHRLAGARKERGVVNGNATSHFKVHVGVSKRQGAPM